MSEQARTRRGGLTSSPQALAAMSQVRLTGAFFNFCWTSHPKLSRWVRRSVFGASSKSLGSRNPSSSRWTVSELRSRIITTPTPIARRAVVKCCSPARTNELFAESELFQKGSFEREVLSSKG